MWRSQKRRTRCHQEYFIAFLRAKARGIPVAGWLAMIVTYTLHMPYNISPMEGKILDEQILDLESLSTLLQNVFNRMDQAALDELAAAVTKERIQKNRRALTQSSNMSLIPHATGDKPPSISCL